MNSLVVRRAAWIFTVVACSLVISSSTVQEKPSLSPEGEVQSGPTASNPKSSVKTRVSDRGSPAVQPTASPQNVTDDITVEARRALGRSSEGRPLEAIVIGAGADVTLLLAGIHGDEPQGTFLVDALASYLRMHPDVWEGRKVILVSLSLIHI